MNLFHCRAFCGDGSCASHLYSTSPKELMVHSEMRYSGKVPHSATCLLRYCNWINKAVLLQKSTQCTTRGPMFCSVMFCLVWLCCGIQVQKSSETTLLPLEHLAVFCVRLNAGGVFFSPKVLWIYSHLGNRDDCFFLIAKPEDSKSGPTWLIW